MADYHRPKALFEHPAILKRGAHGKSENRGAPYCHEHGAESDPTFAATHADYKVRMRARHLEDFRTLNEEG